MRKLMIRWIACGALIIAAMGSGASVELAVAHQNGTPIAEPSGVSPQFGINPVGAHPNGYFEITLAGGHSGSLSAKIVNSGEIEVSLHTFAANVTNPANGGFAAGSEDESPTGPTSWVDVSNAAFELTPDSVKELTIAISVPDGISAGQYVTALVASTTEALPISGTSAFKQIIRSAMPIVITVPGPVEAGFKLGVPEFQAESASLTLNIPLSNTGNILVKPEGNLVLTTTDGTEVLKSAIGMGSVYSGNTSSIQVVVPDQLPVGDYLISANVKDPATEVSVSIKNASVTLSKPEEAETPTFVVDPVSVTANGDPVRYADVAATITNNGQPIPTANVMLNVKRDGKDVESYPLAQNQALPEGSTDFNQRYIPADDWESGTYSFQLVISSISGGTETILSTIDVGDTIVVP